MDDPLRGARSKVDSGKFQPKDRILTLQRSLFPEMVPFSVELRICTLRLIRSVFLNDPKLVYKDEYVELRRRVLFVLCKSLTSSWAEIVDEAFNALSVVTSRSASVDSSTECLDAIQECLNPIMSNLNDYRLLSIPILKGFYTVLKLSIGINYSCIRVGDTFLDHIKFILDSDTPAICAEVWHPSEEQSVIATMMDIFHVLPWTSLLSGELKHQREDLSHFLIKFLSVLIRLENFRSRFPHQLCLASPFIPPFVRFMSKYPETISLLLQPMYIKEQDVSVVTLHMPLNLIFI
jgi:transformation/transcription domain-associated protein